MASLPEDLDHLADPLRAGDRAALEALLLAGRQA
jgi:hypothetical protein